MWEEEQRSCIEMSGIVGELKEWLVCRNPSVSVYLSGGKRKGKEASWIRETEWPPLVHGKSSDAQAETRETREELCCRSVTKLCLTLHDPMDCSMPAFPVVHHLPEFAQTHVQ